MKIQIPLTAGSGNSDRTFRIQLGDNLVEFRQLYRTLLGQWMISASIEGEPLFDGVMLESRVNLIASYNIQESFGALFFVGETATVDNLGIANNLQWWSPDEPIL